MQGAAAKLYTGEQVERSVRLGAFLLVFCGAFALALTRRMMIPAVILGLAGMAAWFLPRKTGRGYFWEVASFVYLIFFIADLFRFSGALAPALVHLFTFILVNKLFNLNQQRDYYQLFLLTFLTVLAAVSFSVEVEMFYMIVLYIVLLVWNIASLTLYHEWMKSRETYFPISLYSPFYWIVVVGASAVAFGFAMGIFFLLPRMQLGFLGGLGKDKVQYVSGFSQKVNLGDINSIQADPDLVMRVRVTPPVDTLRLYWRGIAFNNYDGKAWSASIPGTHFLFQDSSNFYYASRYTGSLESLVRQEFFMEPIDTRVIFGLDHVTRIHGSFGQVSRDPNGTLTGMAHPTTYELWSRVASVNMEQLRTLPDDVPEPIRRFYLQLPFRSQPMELLARSIASSQKSTIDRVLAVRNYLQTNYNYTTTGLPMSQGDPVSEFLFVKKSGHCEYFATSMVLLLRYLEIPARLVNGFREGEFNRIGGFYMVRNSDAHSWVEAYVGGQWIPFDPSPIQDTTGGDSLGAWLNPRRILDSINFFWDRYILIFSGQDQIDALYDIRDRYQEIRGKFRKNHSLDTNDWYSSLSRFWVQNRTALAGSLAGIVPAAYAVLLWARRRRRIEVSRTPVLFYQEMLSILEKKGFTRESHNTPSEFVRAIEKAIPGDKQDGIRQLTDLFYRARYGNYRLTSADHQKIQQSLHLLEHM